MNLEQSKLTVNGTFNSNGGLLWEKAICSQGSQCIDHEILDIPVLFALILGLYRVFFHLRIKNFAEIMAQRIKSVEVRNLGSSVVAGLVPATNPWYGIPPAHQHNYRKHSMGSHADNAALTDESLCAVSEICVN